MPHDDQRKLSRLQSPFKVLYTSYLVVVGFGLIMAFLQILLTHGMADGKFGLSVKDVVYSYYGNRGDSRLESKLNGTMKDKANTAERAAIIEWVRAGGKKDEFEQVVNPILAKNCFKCHNDTQTTLPSLMSYEKVQPYAQIDMGASIESLARFSHIHLFGIAFIYFFVCYIFAQCSNLNRVFQGVCISAPFAFLLLDFVSWWATKWIPSFAWLTIISGTGNAIATGIMINVSLHQMWYPKIVEQVQKLGKRV